MTASYIGSVTVGTSISGAADALLAVGPALQELSAVITAQLSALATAQVNIRVEAVADIQAQLDASLEFGLNVGVDGAAWISGILSGLAALQGEFTIAPPSLSLQLDANAGISAGLQARIDAIDAELSALASIQAALNAALQAALGALQAYLSLSGHLGTAGAHVWSFLGQLQDVGTEIDLVTAESGLSGATEVRGVFIGVQAADASASASFSAVFGI